MTPSAPVGDLPAGALIGEEVNVTPPLNKEPCRLRPPFDVVSPEPVYDRQVSETAEEWRLRRHTDRVAALLEALDGIELGAYDMRIIEWLADWDNGTVGTIASLIHRVRELGGAS